jgi:hypothetical protein
MDQDELIGMASHLYRRDESARFKARHQEIAALQARLRENRDQDVALRNASAGVADKLNAMSGLKNARGEKPFAKSWEMHLLRSVATQCFILEILDHGDPERASAFTLRRVGCPEDPGAKGATIVSVATFLEEQGYLEKAAACLRRDQPDVPEEADQEP